MKNLILKSSFHEKLKLLIIPMMLLTLGVGQMWAEPWLCRSTDGGLKGTKTVGDKLNGGTSWNYTYTTNGGWSNASDIQVLVGTSTDAYKSVNASFVSDDGSNKNVSGNIGNVEFDRSGYWYAVGKYKSGSTTAYTTTNSTWTNNTTLSFGSNSEPYWKVSPPAVSDFAVSTTGSSSILSGTGTTDDPYIISYNGSLKLTLSGSKAKTDANSSLQYYTNNAWNSTASRTISGITSTTKTSVTVKMRCHNSTASLSGTVSEQTIYYQSEPSFTVTVNNDGHGTTSPSGAQSNIGQSIGVAVSATANTNYEFVNWTIISGSGTFTGGGTTSTSASTRFYPTAAATIRANFRSTLTYSLTVNAGSGISSVTGSTDPVTLGNSYAISATPTSGYTFSTWTADPAANGTFTNANTASTNVTVKNGSVTVTGAATENMTTVTVNVNPASAGTLTVGGSAFTPGSTTTAGVATSRTVVATPASGKVFLDWSVSGNATGTSSTNTYTLKGNGSAGTGTLTANFGILSGWNMEGEDFGGWSRPSTYKFVYPYRGMSGVYYIPTTLNKDKWWKVNNGSTPFNATNASTTVSKGTIYNLVEEWSNSSKVSTTLSNVWVVINTNDTKKIWVQDPQTFHNVNVTNEGSGSKGTYKVTLNSTSAFTKGDNVFETTQFANGEGVKITVTGVDGYIPTITIGANVFTFWKQAASYEATFTMGSADVNVNITYTASYAVTFAKTTGCATLSALGPAAATITSGDKVKSGTTIDFSQTASSGYDFTKWYSTNTGSGGTEWGTGSSLSKSITATTSVYPIYTAHTYTGGVLDKKEGSANGSYSVTYLTTSFASKTAPTRTGYNVSGYYKETGRTTLIADASGNLQKSTTYTNSSKQWTYTSSIPTLYTGWTAKQYTITLDKKEGSANGSAKVKYDATSLTNISAPTRTGYHVTGYYGETGRTNMVANASGTLQSNISGFTTGTKWSKDADGTVTLYTKWAANTYTIAFNANDDNYVGTATGTTASIAATYGTSYTLTTNGFAREGYTFDRWTRNEDGTGTSYTDGQTGVSNLTSTNGATVTLYAKWTGKTYTVTLNAREGTCATKSTVVTMGSTYGEGTAGALPTPTPPAGKVFSGWYTSAGGGTQVESSTQVTTAADHTLYAHYAEKAQVYFKNTLGWSKVYVVYDANWDGSQGTGSQGKIYREMTKVSGTSDVYYDDIPDDYITSWRWNIAFNNTYQNNYHAFTSGEAVFRYDFDKKSTMFVPTNATGSTDDGNYQKNGVQYRSTGYSGDGNDPQYTSGYWRTYNNTYSGYTMTYQKSGGSWSSGHKMESSNVSSNVFIYTVHMDANSQYNFAFYKERDVNYKSVQFCYDHYTQINSGNCTDLVVKCEPYNSWMQTTAEGDYVFKLEMKNDGHMYLTVEYPVATGDYRVRYDYTPKGSSVAQHYYSETIHHRANGKDTISVFVHSGDSVKSGTRVMKLEKCTTVNASGVASWNTNYAPITLPSETASGKTSGVYNFIITQNDAGTTASGAYWNKYTGNYYIRTDVSDGGWDLYKYRTDNIMTLSEYSLTQTLSPPYSHYYCRFIGSAGADITYCIATDYSPNISGTMIGDETIGGVGNRTLPATANVRFTWNMETNALRRAYLKNAQNENERFLVLHGKADENIYNTDGSPITEDAGKHLAANELLFEDLGNWIYQVELKAVPNAGVSLIADYNGSDRYLVGSVSSWLTIMGGDGSEKEDILAVYDFKTNRLMTVWKPSGAITEALTDVDVLLIRHAQEAGRTITFGTNGSLTAKNVYGALEFRYNELVGLVANWTSASRPLLKFFVSFPFDVNVSDIFGLNSAYGQAYIIQRYAGDERAAKGFFRGDGTTTFWKTLKAGDVMEANVGYCVIMDNDYLNDDIGHVWDNKGAGSKVYLYFPSAHDVGSIIADETVTIEVPSNECKIDRTFTSPQAGNREVNHQNTDSHWNLMGIPIFDNHSDNGVAGQPGKVFAESGNIWDTGMNYFYEWSPSTNQYAIHTAKNYSFNSMHCYMVQYHGNVTFKKAATPASVAARRTIDEENYQVELQVLDNNEEVINRTYVELRENACDTFALNEDVYMDYNSYSVNVYTLAGNYDVAANVLSLNNQIVQIGVEVSQAGTYVFSMPTVFSGTATLIDTFTGVRTNLAISDYEVQLEKGIDTERFLLELNIEKTTTVIDAVGGNGLPDSGVRKVLIDGVLYIVKDGKVFDARGARIQ